MNGATIAVLDFEKHVEAACLRHGDIAYFDPPYVPSSDTSNFVGYTVDGFSAADQARLVRVLHRLDAAGVAWALSNSDTLASRALYAAPGWSITPLSRSGTVSSSTTKRAAVGEILVRNFT